MIHEWEDNCRSLEVEVVSLRIDLDKIKAKKKNRIGLGYCTPHESSMGKMNFMSAGVKEPQRYAKIYQDRIHEEKREKS